MNKRRVRILLGISFLAVLIASELPFLLTLAKTGWSTLPPVVDYPADEMLYLNFTVIQHISPQTVINPWYGEAVPVTDVPHLKFPLTFRLFGLLRRLFHSWTGTMLIWTGIWSLLAFAAAFFCLRSVAPELDESSSAVFAFALVMLRSPLAYITAVTHVASSRALLDLTLPYERFAFPQVALPAFLAYWGFLAKALRTQRWPNLISLALMQFFCCVTFPYIVPLLAVGTLAALAISLFQRHKQTLPFIQVVALAAACAALDGAYLLFTGGAHSGGNLKLSLAIHPQQILPSFRPYVALLFVAAVLAMFSRISFAGRTVAAGLAIASGVLGFANVFFPEESLMLIHFNYVNAISTWLALFVFLWPLLVSRSRHWLPVLGGGLFLLALAEGYANYLRSLDFNQLQSAAVAEVRQLGLTASDVVLAPANMSDDISCWIPLVSPARVVFTRDAENILPPASIYGEQALRQAFYLNLTGITYQSLLALTEPGNNRPIPGSFILFGEEAYLGSPLPAERVRGRLLVRQRLLPPLARLEDEPQLGQFLFFGAERVVIIDDNRQPNFVRSALTKWIDIVSEKDVNRIHIIFAKTKTTETVGASAAR